MGFLSYAEPHNRQSLPHTPPDLVSFGCSPSPNDTSSRGPPPKDLAWPHPKPPISPPMSSHDQPLPPPSARRSRSPPRTASPSSIGGAMSMSATAAASLARASISAITDAGAGARAAPTTISTTPSTTGPAEDNAAHNLNNNTAAETNTATTTSSTAATTATTTTITTTTTTTGLSSSPRHGLPQLPGAAPPQVSSGPLPERLPSLTSIFGPPPTSAQSGGGPLSAGSTSSYSQRSYMTYDQHGRPTSPGFPAAQAAYLPPPQSATSQQGSHEPYPSGNYQHQHYQRRDQRSPRADERQPVSQLYQPPSPRSHEHEQQPQQQQQQQHSHQWPDARSNYVAVGKWSLQDGQQPSSPSFYYRQQQQAPAAPPAQSYSSHRTAPLPPPPPTQQQQRSPVRGPAHDADRRPSPGSGNSLPSTPASGAFPDAGAGAGAGAGGVPKEGLGMGPKIWTGVDFLPQFMHASEVPGEGLCYFYDDGTHCKAVIDGEAVNPYWGVTKAGKPRKRLAIACITCREKKIKCDPEYPRCVQCEKFGRVCRFKNAPRGGNNNSPGTASTEPDNHRKFGSVTAIRPPPESPSSSALNANNKRMRSDYDHYKASGRGRSPPFSNRSPTLSSSSSSADPLRHSSTSSVLPPPHVWGSGQQPQSSPLPPPPPPSYPRSTPQQPYSPHSQFAQHDQLSPRSQYPPHSQLLSSAHDHHRSHPYPDHHYSHHTHDSYAQPRSQSGSPSQSDLPRMLLPPPRSAPDLPRIHDDVLRRSWQSDRGRV
ncbi:uncharacterized protein SPSK_04997 [Sporothrix schenckii 1099-18]|uniref:Zn(2)-C6 fungal-type domain-containing protein n=2 Tax=Sporothrix schenckii TaxID=29908 RepID=U7Q4J3_SPOS1|nr:uncharacterized protein SPSK_04997 [Sporothrix schenckii 1099-18]ERT02097.1 hypothetical protein HMPREF1624_00394 [Sporothrix schenckii ATCC 58251]KJR80693.1 hypothetical protein SPSK_04997 [Sporothrix schenckii 1099-18]